MATQFYHCPKCKSESITANSFDIDGDIAWQEVVCSECGYAWNDVYTFSRAEMLDTDKEIDENGNIVPERDLWGSDSYFTRADWKYDVVNGNTNLGYWDWTEHQREMKENEELLDGSVNL